ncbi:MAG TPA: hypothetical protein VMS21_10285 [Methylomirabilota bacterium]|nr:hypothetical protein [Methylomirabilota bacterium]
MRTSSRLLSRAARILLCCSFGLSAIAAETGRVTLIRTPDGGIQPQAAVDAQGVVHLIYYKGDARSGDLFHVRQRPGQETFSDPVQLNTRPGSAMAIGTIRGAQIALGRNGRVHVAWNGRTPEDGGHAMAPMLYTRMNDSGTGFEPERDVITSARGLDGGGSVAADPQGNVYVFWHAPGPGGAEGEAGRAVFVARSSNDGETFAPEKPASTRPTGACGCCGMKAFADSAGNVLAWYRTASEMVNRDETLLRSRNRGVDFEVLYSHGWKIATCPMSSAFLSETKDGVLAAAETHERVFYVRVNSKTGRVSEPVSPPTRGKHPVVVGNDQGEVLLAWTEGTGWGQGGTVAWRVYDETGNPTSEQGRADGVPTWSLVAAVTRPDGGFVIFH